MEDNFNKILIEFVYCPVIALGPGRRVGIWLRGCTIHCKGCISEELWSFDQDKARRIEDVTAEVLGFFEKDQGLNGVTVSGGEPFDQAGSLISLLKNLNDGGVKDILVYTGYSADAIYERHGEISRIIAAVVDSPFISGEETEVGWKGSANQTLTVFNSQFAADYEKWSNVKKGNLQMAELSGRILSIGIPWQKDVSRIRKMVLAKVREEAGE
jgi:anaerobic ribonucleoside-triphosphate reductase activating protein